MYPAPIDQTLRPKSAAFAAMVALLGADDALDDVATIVARGRALPETVTGRLIDRARAKIRARRVMLGCRHG